MKKGIKRVLSIAMVGTTLAFAVMGAGCNNTVTDWFEEQYNQLTCEHKNESELEAVAATCTEDGLTKGVECADCGKILVKQDKVKALGHDTIKHEKVESTCMTSGLTAGEYCLVCNTWVKEQKKINATGHKVVELKAVAATCTETGLTTGQACEYCDEVYQAQQVIAALGHSYNDNHACTTCGECDHNFVDYECEYCGVSQYQAVSAADELEVGATYFVEVCLHDSSTMGGETPAFELYEFGGSFMGLVDVPEPNKLSVDDSYTIPTGAHDDPYMYGTFEFYFGEVYEYEDYGFIKINGKDCVKLTIKQNTFDWGTDYSKDNDEWEFVKTIKFNFGSNAYKFIG